MALQLDPEDPSLYDLRGKAHKELQHFEETEKDLFMALQSLNSDPVFYFSLAKKYMDKGDKEKSKKFLESGLESFEDERESRLTEDFQLDK